jgi:uncharacterized protein YjbI with pentapeptide repeats
VLVSFGAIEGVNPISHPDRGVPLPAGEGSLAYRVDPRTWVPLLLAPVGLSPFAQLDDNGLSTKPSNWTTGETKAELDGVRGGDFEGRNLRYALSFGAFGVKAYYQNSDATGADFRFSDLRLADFRKAMLERANFRYAVVAEADFRWAKLMGAKLGDVDARKARFDEATCTGTIFTRADLTDANLTLATFDGADFTEAILKDCNLTGADLRKAKGLTREQVAAAQVDATTKLPESLREPAGGGIPQAAPAAPPSSPDAGLPVDTPIPGP